MNKFRPLVLKALFGIPLTIASLYFIGKYILDHWHEVSSSLREINTVTFLLGIFFLLLFFLFRSITWNKLLALEGFSPPAAHSVYLLSVSEIKRYIPGSILGLLSRISHFNSFKIPTQKILKLIFYESVIFLITSVALSVPAVVFLWEHSSLASDINPNLIIAALIVVFVLTLTIYMLPQKHADHVFDIFKHLHKYRRTFLYMLIAWVMFGLGGYFIGASLNFMQSDKIVELSSIFILSWVIGYLVAIIPLGLGVREAFITYGLWAIMPVPVAATIAILTRIGLVVAEVVFLAGAFLFFRFIKRVK